ncbi:MAG TPA: TonB-dependent receptor [Cellvibrio sp.]|nr:TonB-dependent receptor [Cellvibrio sp.]
MRFTKKLLALAVSGLVAAPALAAEAQGRLDRVVVSATLAEETTATAPAFTTVVTAEDIAKSSVTSLADLLRETAGVTNYTDPSGRDELQIRGLSGQYTLILVNGKRVSSAGALWRGGDFDYSSVPLNSIERVEIIRGPMSSLYGADAIGGVVNIITKKAPDEGWVSSLNGEYRAIEAGEGGQQHRIGFNTSGALSESLRLSLSTEQSGHAAWYADEKTALAVPDLEEKKAQNLLTTLSWKLADNQNLDFDLGYNKDRRPYSVFSSGPDYRDQKISRFDAGVTHKGTWSWGESTSYIKQENSNIDDFNSRYNAPKNRHLKEQNTYAKTYFVAPVVGTLLTAGIDYRQQVIEDAATYLKTGEFSVDQIALFAQDEIIFGDSVSLTLGGRLDDHEIFGDHFSPKAYLVYEATENFTLKGGVNKAFKAPDGSKLSEEYSIISCGGKCYLAGNPDLKPESSTSYEAGFVYKQSSWDIGLSYFKNDIEDMIEREVTYDTNNNPVGAEWINIATAMTRGVEFEGSYAITSWLALKGNYTYLDTEYVNIDGDKTVLPYRLKDKATLGLNWKVTDKFSTDLTVNYLAGMQYSSWVQSGGTWVQAFPTLPAYYRTDLTFAYQANEALALRFGVKNIENIRLDKEDENFATHELGRNFYLSATHSF